MKILVNNTFSIPHKGVNHNFLNNIRDRNTSLLDSLQKQKIETLLKYREAKKVVETYRHILNQPEKAYISEQVIQDTVKNMHEMEDFLATLWNKLREINLAILAEEEKNY